MHTWNWVQPAFTPEFNSLLKVGSTLIISDFDVSEEMAECGWMWTEAEIAILLNDWSKIRIQK